MAEVPTYEKVVAALTAGFVLFTGGWLWSQNRAHGDYQVTVLERREESGSGCSSFRDIISFMDSTLKRIRERCIVVYMHRVT